MNIRIYVSTYYLINKHNSLHITKCMGTKYGR